MAVNLTKGQKISLAKSNGGALSEVIMGLGWDMAGSSGKKGLLGGLFGGGGSVNHIDLDASCLVFDENKNLVDIVYFGQLGSKDGSIKHTGDNLTGEGDGDDEEIIVNLNKVPASVKTLIFTVNSYRGQTFAQVENAFCRLVDKSNNEEIARYNLSAQGNHTAMIMAKVYRHNGEWKMHAIGENANGTTAHDLAGVVKPFL